MYAENVYVISFVIWAGMMLAGVVLLFVAYRWWRMTARTGRKGK
jgi:preprotein translocase subunit Sec63